MTDDTVYNLGKVTGENGEKGDRGEAGDKGDKGDKGDAGSDGADGVGVKNAAVDENGNLIITLTDGTVHNLGKVTGVNGNVGAAGKDGQNGQNGSDGNGIQSAHIDSDGNLIITFTDGVITNLGKIVGSDGKDGKDGADGKDGKDGIGIKGCRIDDDGNLILTLTDNTTLDAGNITAISDRVSVSRPLATAAVSVSGTSLLWNIITLAVAIIRKKKYNK